ncbi:probable cationic amino acid transporter [Centruroides sculpturatus]|uniref:probable cationic amino acid transporter n=2 Tax=Centruroides sculpturatus TaxID=218467 RepID=UPI000C6EC25F|nr:probable cationic amino acid transporter [Centruroides sculpturatus]
MFVDGDRNLRQKLLNLVGKLLRTKDPGSAADSDPDARTQLKKCLTTLDLTSLGVGSCVGTGMYLVAGMVARNIAGPGVVMSFLVAAVASLFSGVCYAEFGVRVPRTTGSAYMYSYVTVGEFIAFVIGWNMILEYLIGTAAGACAISACIDSMVDGAIGKTIRDSLGTFIGHTPDVLAAVITVLMTILMVAGVKKSLLFNNVLNAVNLAVWVFIIVAGLFYVDGRNWSQHGGFLPYGWSGVLAGAATCFYAFIGFDIIATTGEEAENPKWSIPTAIILSLIIVLTAYISSSLMITLVLPYDQIDAESALVQMFDARGATKSKYVVAVGALAGLVVSMFGSMFPMPRVVYAMAKDGLIFRSLARVWPVTGTPASATCFLGAATSFVSLIVGLDVLVEMMSIGTLMAYTLVSTCVLILRYQPRKTTLVELLPESIRSACPTPSKEVPDSILTAGTTTVRAKRTNRVESSDSDESPPPAPEDNPGYGSLPVPRAEKEEPFTAPPHQEKSKMLSYLFPYWNRPGPATEKTGMLVMKAVGVLYLLIVGMDLIVVCAMPALEAGSGAAIFFLLIFLFGLIACLVVIARQPQSECDLKFKAPGIPFVPVVAVTVNIYLIMKLSILTLVRFTVWMSVGLLMYFCYGIKHSTIEKVEDGPFELQIPRRTAEKAEARDLSWRTTETPADDTFESERHPPASKQWETFE